MKYITHGGKAYNLKLSINAMIMFEDVTGKDISVIEEDTSIKTVRALFYCCLVGGGNQVTIEEAGDILGDVMAEQGADKIGRLLGEVAEQAMGKQKPHQRNQKKPPVKR